MPGNRYPYGDAALSLSAVVLRKEEGLGSIRPALPR